MSSVLDPTKRVKLKSWGDDKQKNVALSVSACRSALSLKPERVIDASGSARSGPDPHSIAPANGSAASGSGRPGSEHAVRLPVVGMPVTGQCATAPEFPIAGVGESTPERRHIFAVEVDQVGRIGAAVRIMTGRAGGDGDVRAVLRETLVAEEALTAVALVAERIRGRALREGIRHHQL